VKNLLAAIELGIRSSPSNEQLDALGESQPVEVLVCTLFILIFEKLLSFLL